VKSKNGKRHLHGKLGEGRLRAFALGSEVAWVSNSDNSIGEREEVTIRGTRRNRDHFRWDAVSSTSPATGTTVIADNQEQRSLGALEKDGVLSVLLSHFAPILLDDTGLRISYDKNHLDPAQEIEHDTSISVTFGAEGQHQATLRIIEWRNGTHRAIYFGPDNVHFPYAESGSHLEGQFAYSAYVIWDGLGLEELAVVGLGDMAPDPVGPLWSAARVAIRDHFATRRRQRRRDHIEKWKASGVYPYKGEPASEPERAERAVFDVVSGTLVPHISKTNKDAKLTLALLQEAIRHDPDKLTAILHEVVSLSDVDRDTLTRLLAETTLSAIIRSANLVANRNKFLAGLEHLLFDPSDASQVGERDHLHKILERELWVFGEAYHLMNSERGLTEIARTHLKLEGLPTKDLAPVVRWDGSRGRVDLHLAAQYKEHDHIRHLVVELKAPEVTVTQNELNQVEGYVNTVRTNPAFATGKASWDFILVATDFDDLVDDRITEEYRDTGQFLAPPQKAGRPQVRAFVRRWRDVIDENKRRLDFVTTALEHDPSVSAGLDFVRQEYKDLLPAALAAPGL
jgi:hypothetical protein